MKKILLIATALLVLAGTVNALPPKGYIGLFADEGHAICSVTNPGGFFPFRMWIWCLPSVNGMQAAEFMITYPANIIGSTVTQNPGINVALGSLNAGISVSYANCNMEWVWTHYQDCYITSTTPSWINVVAHPGSGKYQFASCLLGFPLEDIFKLNNLAINQQCLVATEDATWGAIKSLF